MESRVVESRFVESRVGLADDLFSAIFASRVISLTCRLAAEAGALPPLVRHRGDATFVCIGPRNVSLDLDTALDAACATRCGAGRDDAAQMNTERVEGDNSFNASCIECETPNKSRNYGAHPPSNGEANGEYHLRSGIGCANRIS